MYEVLIKVTTVLLIGILQRLVIYYLNIWSVNARQALAAMGLRRSNA
jgi:hypothetical protein